MTNHKGTYMNFRKRILTVVTAGLIVALAVAAPGQSQDKKAAKKVMEGSWRVTVTPGPSPVPLPPSAEAIVTYIPGGGLIESDNLAVPGSLAGTGQGTWEATGPREFNITLTKVLFTTQGLFQGSLRISESIIRNSNDTEYTGVGRMALLDPTGAVILIIPATTTATRIGAEMP